MRMLLFSILLLFAAVTRAGDHDAVQRAVEAGQIRPLSEILTKVQAQYAGRVIDVDLERTRTGTFVYEIKLSGTEGGRRTLYVDAATGEMTEGPKRSMSADASLRPLDGIVREVMRRYPGQVIELELERGRDRQNYYEIKILQPSGHIIEVHIDALTGKEVTSDLLQGEGLKQVRPLPDMIQSLLARYGGVIKEIELERESDKSLVYKFEIRRADGGIVEVEVDAVSGVVHKESGTKY